MRAIGKGALRARRGVSDDIDLENDDYYWDQ